MALPRTYEVNQFTHQQWMKRHQLVERLAAWVQLRLDDDKRGRKETGSEREGKALQYVYEHFAVGKMKYPVENMDPLFTHQLYEDASMINMLKREEYPRFQAQVQQAILDFDSFVPDSLITVTMEDALRGLSRANKERIEEVQAEFERVNPRKSATWKHEQVIGLVLRYKCMGGFSDNLHGSVPYAWSRLLPDYVECFASPFNHKFRTYYSMYEQDRVFGSLGNFFTMIHAAEGILPSGKYEINPPWNNEMYESLVKIFRASLGTQDIHAVIVGPNWKDASWCSTDFEKLQREFPAYTARSLKDVHLVWYVNDATRETFPQVTAYWVFSKTGMSDDLLRELGLKRGRDQSQGDDGRNHRPRHYSGPRFEHRGRGRW